MNRRNDGHFKFLLRGLLAASVATIVLAAGPLWVAQANTLEQRMQRFRDGSLRGFALAELPDNGQEIYSEADFKDLAATGANVVRVAITLRKCKGCQRYDTPEADIRYAQSILQRGERHGFGVVLVLVAMPWGDESDYWDSPALVADIVRHWGELARRLKAYPALLAYDLINEPVVPKVRHPSTPTSASFATSPTLLPPSLRSAQSQWHELATAISQALRAADPHTPLMLEPTPWGLPSSFWRTEVLKLPGVVYSFHFYEPQAFTHQGLHNHNKPLVYPAADWNAQHLSKAVEEARRFAAQHQVPLFVGEFSCVRWAPMGSCPRYLSDAIELFEREGWGWAYHCWRCYQGWDAEVPENVPQDQRDGHLPQHRRADSPSLLLLKKALARKPPAARH